MVDKLANLFVEQELINILLDYYDPIMNNKITFYGQEYNQYSGEYYDYFESGTTYLDCFIYGQFYNFCNTKIHDNITIIEYNINHSYMKCSIENLRINVDIYNYHDISVLASIKYDEYLNN